MPELPEVETVMQGIKPILLSAPIKKITINKDQLRQKIPTDFKNKMTNNKVEEIYRRGKYMIALLNNDVAWIIHLGMTGSFTSHETKPDEWEKHDHVILQFSNGKLLSYNDPRRFGLMTLTSRKKVEEHALLNKMGCEPLSEKLNAQYLYDALQKRTSHIKAALMDQRIVAGLGNIYVCEALFDTGIHPERLCKNVSLKECETLSISIKKILGKAIEAGGSTLNDYHQVDGNTGYFQHQFFVYGKKQEPCVTCGTTVERIVQQGRSTFYCPNCQS